MGLKLYKVVNGLHHPKHQSKCANGRENFTIVLN